MDASSSSSKYHAGHTRISTDTPLLRVLRRICPVCPLSAALFHLFLPFFFLPQTAKKRRARPGCILSLERLWSRATGKLQVRMIRPEGFGFFLTFVLLRKNTHTHTHTRARHAAPGEGYPCVMVEGIQKRRGGATSCGSRARRGGETSSSLQQSNSLLSPLRAPPADHYARRPPPPPHSSSSPARPPGHFATHFLKVPSRRRGLISGADSLQWHLTCFSHWNQYVLQTRVSPRTYWCRGCSKEQCSERGARPTCVYKLHICIDEQRPAACLHADERCV